MEIIGKTKKGFIIEASTTEVVEILNAVSGSRPTDIEIGHKIPAIDYAATITKIKNLKFNTTVSYLFSYTQKVADAMKKLENQINEAHNIES